MLYLSSLLLLIGVIGLDVPWLQCFNMGHNGHGIKLYGVVMILMGNVHAGG